MCMSSHHFDFATAAHKQCSKSCDTIHNYSDLLIISDGSVALEEFEASLEGIIQCAAKCFPTYDCELEELWSKDSHFWN